MKGIIVDANRCGDFTTPLSGHAELLVRKMKDGSLKIVVGGQLLAEIAKTRFIAFVSELIRSGRAMRVDEALLDRECRLVASFSISSDDPHIIALARLSNVRLLYTEDRLLIGDFRDTRFISPKGKIITRRTPVSRVKLLTK